MKGKLKYCPIVKKEEDNHSLCSSLKNSIKNLNEKTSKKKQPLILPITLLAPFLNHKNIKKAKTNR